MTTTKAERGVYDWLQRGGLAAIPFLKRYQTATFNKPDVTTTDKGGAWTTANTGLTLFTVTGTVLCRVYGDVSTLLVSTSNTGTLAVGVAGATTLYLGTTTVNATNFILNSVWVDTAPTVKAKALAAINSEGGWILTRNANIILTIATNNLTAGGANVYCDWIPVSSDGNIV